MKGKPGGGQELEKDESGCIFLILVDLSGFKCCWSKAQELSSVLCDDLEEWDWGERSKGRGYTYACSQFTLFYSRHKHNLVKQFYYT